MVFIGERRGWELGVSAPGLLMELEGEPYLLSYLGLGKTVSCCSLLKKIGFGHVPGRSWVRCNICFAVKLGKARMGR